MTFEEIEKMASDAVAKAMADHEARKQPKVPTPDEEISARLNEMRFREAIGDHALNHGVRPSAIRHVVRDAEEIFELRDGVLVARNEATDPGDPVSPLTPQRWLEHLAVTDGYLFATKEK